VDVFWTPEERAFRSVRASADTDPAVKSHDAKAVVEQLLAAYPGTATREQTASIYTKYLSSLDKEATERVVENLIASSIELPTIAEIRAAVVNAELQLPTPLEAWRAASTKGSDLHPLVRDVCDLFGGTYNIRSAEQPTIMRAQFLKAYTERRDEVLRDASVTRLRWAA